MHEDEKAFTLPSVWELFRDAVRWLHGIFGPPMHVRLCGTHKRTDHQLFMGWIRSLEAFASCLLFAGRC